MESNIFLHLHGIFFNQFKEERELMETGLEDRLIEGGQHTGKGGGGCQITTQESMTPSWPKS